MRTQVIPVGNPFAEEFYIRAKEGASDRTVIEVCACFVAAGANPVHHVNNEEIRDALAKAVAESVWVEKHEEEKSK